jgi:hypothetical protein
MIAQLDGVLDGQRFLLLHLLRHAHQFLGAFFLGQVLLKKNLELFVDLFETRSPVSGYCSITCTTRLISASSAPLLMPLASKPSTQEPMWSISWRAG